MVAQLARIGMGFDDARVRLFPAVRPAAADGFPSIGARGCFMSHLEILRLAEHQGLGRILVLEDDVDFAPDFTRRIGNVVKALSEQAWSIFYGGYVIEPLPGSGTDVRQVGHDRSIRTTHFLALQQPAIGRVTALFETLLARPPGDAQGGPMHVDGAYNWFRRLHPDAETLICVPPLGRQRSSRTDVHSLPWYDSAPLARHAVATLRRLKNAIRFRAA